MLLFKLYNALAIAALAITIPVEIGNITESDLVTSTTSNGVTLVERIQPCTTKTTKATFKIGNGDPHQNFIFKQVSAVTECKNNPGYDTGHSNGFGCPTNSGTHPGNLCAFERIQVTAYTVGAHTCKTCTGNCLSCDGGGKCQQDGPAKAVIFAPNAVQGGCFYNNYQVKLPCGPVGTHHLIKRGPAGGPKYVSCDNLSALGN